MAIDFIRNQDIPLCFANGYAQTELLPGVYPLVKAYRGVLRENAEVTLASSARTFDVYCFTAGRGDCVASSRTYTIDALCFFVPDPQKPFTLHAATELVFTRFTVTMLDSDLREWNETHCCLPWFKTLDACEPYWQACKSENTQSWYVICRKLLPRTIMGVVRAQGPGREGTAEAGHPNVAQWNVMLPGADIVLTVGEENVAHMEGDFSYVEAGAPHSLISNPGKLNYYIWFEHFVKELADISWQP